jgi:hypothetical protein
MDFQYTFGTIKETPGDKTGIEILLSFIEQWLYLHWCVGQIAGP